MATPAMTAEELPRRFSKHLVPDERVVVGSRRHAVRVVEPIASAAAAVVLVVWLDSLLPRDLETLPQLLWLLPLAAVGRAGWRVWEWSEDWFVVTDRRLMLGYGVFTRKVAMMPMRKVTDMSYNRTPLGQVLNYGEFVLESAGQDQALHDVDYLPDPDHLYRLICTEIFGPDGVDEEDGGPLPATSTATSDGSDGSSARAAGPVPAGEWQGFRLGPEHEPSQRDTGVVRRVTVTSDDPGADLDAVAAAALRGELDADHPDHPDHPGRWRRWWRRLRP